MRVLFCNWFKLVVLLLILTNCMFVYAKHTNEEYSGMPLAKFQFKLTIFIIIKVSFYAGTGSNLLSTGSYRNIDIQL